MKDTKIKLIHIYFEKWDIPLGQSMLDTIISPIRNIEQETISIEEFFDSRNRFRKRQTNPRESRLIEPVKRRIIKMVYSFHFLKILYIEKDIDLCNYKDRLSKICKKHSLDKADIIGMSIHSRLQLFWYILLAKYLKKEHNKTIVFGGNYIKLYKDLIDLRRFRFIDFMVHNNAEKSFIELIRHIEEGSEPKEVDGIIYLKGDKIIKTQRHDFTINHHAPPSYPTGMLIEIKKEKKFPPYFGFPYEVIRGCNSNCAFCNFKNSDRIEFKDIGLIIKDLSYLKKKYDINVFRFITPHINMDLYYMDRLCDALIVNRLDIQWICHASANFNRIMLRKMKKAGCSTILYGVESANENTQRRMRKNLDLKRTQEIIKNTYEEGIYTKVSVVAGFPHENHSEFKNTVEFIIKNKKYISLAIVYPFCLTYGTDIFNNPKTYGIRVIGNANRYDLAFFKFHEVKGLPWPIKRIQTMHSLRYAKKKIIENNMPYSIDFMMASH